MMRKFAVDTNILVYAQEEANSETSEIALNLIAAGANTSHFAFQEFLFKYKKVLTKKDIFKKGIKLLEILNLNYVDKDTYFYAKKIDG